MITVLKDVADYMFSSALDKITILTDQPEVQFKLLYGDTEILNETYVPDAEGKITILDLQDLIEPYLASKLIGGFFYVIVVAGKTDTVRGFTVQYCAAESSLDAKEFMLTHFLTAMIGGDKITAMGRKEFLHLVVSESTEVVVSCDYRTTDDKLVSKEFVLDTLPAHQEVATIDVSPDSFISDLGTMVRYTVTAGGRVQYYQIDLACPDAAPCLLFTNSFGCQETFYCTGTHTLEPEYERSSAMIDGMFRHYHIEENRVFKANTGILNTPMSLWADDLFRSKEIYLLEGERPGKEIAITESESTRTNDYDNLPAYTFSYRYAQRNQNILQLSRAGRVFDNTFDNTFG